MKNFKIGSTIVNNVTYGGATVNKILYKGVVIYFKENEEVDDNVEWSVDFTMLSDGRNDTDLKTILTTEQLADITDENCAGPEYDGNNRLIAVYFLGVIGLHDMPEPYLLPWAEDTSAIDKVMSDMAAAGFNDINSPIGGYYLDEGCSLQLKTTRDYKMRIEKHKIPLSNN